MTPSPDHLNYLLFQIRNQDDAMRDHEVNCFASGLGCKVENIRIHSLLNGPPANEQLQNVDAVLIGGSGDYSVVSGGEWLEGAMESMRELVRQKIPTFASCWGFQALARALGGKVVHDLDRAEIGTLEIQLTEFGQEDPLFAPLGNPFFAQMGHEDIVDAIPPNAKRLASTGRVTNEAFMFPGTLIYATQFHPELQVEDLLLRLKAYPKYVKKIMGLEFEEFSQQCQPTTETRLLLSRFAEKVLEWKKSH